MITLKDTVMDVQTRSSTNPDTIITHPNLALPPSGVVFVEKVGTCSIESPARMHNSSGPSNTGPGCAVLTLKGRYAKSLTLGSRDDILINGDIAAQTMENVTIEAAILALNDSFIRERLREELHVRRPPALPQPAVPRGAGQGLLEDRPQQRAGARGGVSVAVGHRQRSSSRHGRARPTLAVCIDS